MKRFCNVCWIALATVSFLAAADATYLGKWKLNPAKSQLTGETVSIEQSPSGGMRYVSAETAYDFKLDGKEYPTPGGSMAAWKEAGPDTWDVTIKTNGQLVATIQLTVKGDTLTSMAHRPKAGGGMLMDTSTLKRVSGGPGIVGKWKSTEVKQSASALEISSDGPDSLTLTVPEFGLACMAKFDGKDYAMTGPQAAPKEKYSFKKTGANSFQMTEKIDGKAVYVDKFTVSADGKTLTDDGTPISRKEPTKAVYDRQ